MPYHDKTIAVLIPAYNEEQSIGLVLTELLALRDPLTRQPLVDDIVVCDNASTDQTARIVKQTTARLVSETQLGYGAACLKAIDALTQAPPDVVVFVDADHSVDVAELNALLDQIMQGADLVIGCRTTEKQQKYALTTHQRFGNWLAALLIKLLWDKTINDLGPFRAITYKSLLALTMADRQFGWTVEMQIKALSAGLHVKEVPVSSLKRIGKSKISGTLRGTIGAGKGILGTIFRLYRKQQYQPADLKGGSSIYENTK